MLIRDITSRKIRILTMIDEYCRTCLVADCAMRIRAGGMIEQLADPKIVHRRPKDIRSDNDSELITNRLRDWCIHVGLRTTCIEPGSSGIKVTMKAGTLRDNPPDGEIFWKQGGKAFLIQRIRHYNCNISNSLQGSNR